ncbi:DNA (cytosine-5)-methyltransferase 1 [Natronocella acetinitrilica]|uniref:DNA (cytosine-5-)-methyltransferase n=1 Tax=Natronocella acetinitrilica TaxID=414046 RepID=A0AAE3G6W1_9GAMM|nr:DNA cytosine methyltransferase [Natronocella acetinitrilica]MCP1675493.1 DNA (cytosine-5)-methyltransferase 1 [Natronocella acetinitrilica]
MMQQGLNLGHEIVVDLFAGGGGASLGIEQALDRPVDVAVNHDPQAVAMHAANHPGTEHFCESVFRVHPVAVTRNQPVGLLWASPDCTHHSKAKGGKPVSSGRRGLAWVVIKWARRIRPRVIMLENVEEFADWGPLTPEGMPCAVRKGQTFRQWIAQLERLGYQVEARVLRACDYGAPTIRKRLFVIARRDGRPIVWPKPSHGPAESIAVKRRRRLPYRTAAECIDWSLPCHSIFERKRPLAENTMRRIAQGMKRYVIEAAEPFIIAIDHASARTGSTWAATQPLSTITTENRHALVTAFLAKHYGGVIGHTVGRPIGTITTVDHHSLVAASMAPYMMTMRNAGKPFNEADKPLHTITAGGAHMYAVAAFMAPYYGSGSGETGRDLRQPAPTCTTKDRLQLVTVQIDGATYVITDIGMRMLQPRELFNANGFPPDYVIDQGPEGKPLPKYAQVRMCGNSVPPVWPRALVSANFAHEQQQRGAA